MRNLKRALSLALAAIMLIGMMVVSASAVSYNDLTDKDQIVNKDAVSMLVSLGIIEGKPDGSYGPTENVDRAQMAKMISVIMNQGVDNGALYENSPSGLTDISSHWAKGHINYCYTTGIIAGRGNGKFDPSATVTALEAAKMLLVAVGYDPAIEGFEGADWAINVSVRADEQGIFEGFTKDLSAPLNRDDAALLIYNALDVEMIQSYTTNNYPIAYSDHRTILADKYGVIKVQGVVVANEWASLASDDGDAALKEGKTTIYNAACEPYVQQLCRMLNRMGAKIEGIASNLLTIEGVDELHGTEHTILPDMIEVGSFIGMAAMTRSELTIKNVSYENLGIIPDSFRRLGIKMEQRGDDIYVPAQETYEIESFIDGSIMTIADAPWPGLTPDLLSVLLVVATQAKGSVLIHQKMFESRLFFVDKLIDMGAQIILCDPHRAVVIGHDHGFKLRGGNMTSPDIRAGIALLIAAMSADGISRIHNIEQIDRGYQNIEGRLNALGARITRIE